MPKPIDVAEAKVFKTKHGGCKPEHPDRLHPTHPLYDPTPTPDLPHERVQSPPKVKGGFVPGLVPPTVCDNRAEWAAHFVNESQGGTGICTAEAAIGCHHWVRYKVQQASAIRLSAGFVYYANTHDRTFTQGSGIGLAIATMLTYGACLGTYYSQDYLLQHFNTWPGHAFTDDELPQPPAYNDGLTRKMLRWTRLAYSNPDINLLKQRIAQGYPIAFGMGNHAMWMVGYLDGVFLCPDSEMAGIDNGYGPGIRGFMFSAIQSQAFDLCTIEEVDVSGQAPAAAPLAMPTGVYNFGQVKVGQSALLPQVVNDTAFSIVNTSTSPVSIRASINGPGASQFQLGNPILAVQDYIMQSNESMPMMVAFTPTLVGTWMATVSITSSTPASPQSFQLSGVAVAATQSPPPPPPPTGNTQMLIDTIKADANALVLGQITQAQIDKIKADVALLVPDATTTTPPPSTSTVILAPNAIPKDAAGNTWTWGALVRADLGYSLALNGRALKTATKVAIVSGVLRCYDPGGGGWFAYTGGPQGPFTWASSSAP